LNVGLIENKDFVGNILENTESDPFVYGLQDPYRTDKLSRKIFVCFCCNPRASDRTASVLTEMAHKIIRLIIMQWNMSKTEHDHKENPSLTETFYIP
jgi:hypothetical protein